MLKTRSVSVSRAAAVARVMPRVKHLFMSREPDRNVASFLSLNSSVADGLVQRFFKPCLRQMIKEAVPENTEVDLLAERILAEFQGRPYDQVWAWTLTWCFVVQCYLEYSRKGQVDFHFLDYDSLVRDPRGVLTGVLKHCQVDSDDATLSRCLQALGKDSQEGTQLSRVNLGERRTSLSEEESRTVRETLERFGFVYGAEWRSTFEVSVNNNNNIAIPC